MDRRTAAGRDCVANSFPHEVVLELQGVLVLAEQAGAREDRHGLQEWHGWAGRKVNQVADVDRATEHGQGAHEFGGVVRQGLDALQDPCLHASWGGLRGEVGDPALHHQAAVRQRTAQQFLQVERVTACRGQPLAECLAGRSAADIMHHQVDGVGGEGRERQQATAGSLHPLQDCSQAGRPGPWSSRDDDGHGQVAVTANEVRQHGQRPAVGPLHVVEEHQPWGGRSQFVDQFDDRILEAQAFTRLAVQHPAAEYQVLRAGVRCRRKGGLAAAAQGRGMRAQRGEPQAEGPSQFHFVRGAAVHLHAEAWASALGELVEHAGLSDACSALHHGERTGAGGGEGKPVGQPSQLLLAPTQGSHRRAS